MSWSIDLLDSFFLVFVEESFPFFKNKSSPKWSLITLPTQIGKLWINTCVFLASLLYWMLILQYDIWLGCIKYAAKRGIYIPCFLDKSKSCPGLGAGFTVWSLGCLSFVCTNKRSFIPCFNEQFIKESFIWSKHKKRIRENFLKYFFEKTFS